MADNETKPSANDGREELVAKQLASTKIHLALTQKRVDVSGAIKLPLERIPQLGVAFASLPSMFRTVTNTVSVPTLLQATDKYGNPLDPSKLNTFKDGSGLTGGYRDAAKGLGQARFHVVEGDIATSVTQVPYDPTSLFMAAAIAQINQKLDSIQESVDEMFEYMRQRDKANMRGNLKTLADILNGYGLNYGNATYMANAHMKVLDIKQSSAQDMELFRSQAQADLKKERVHRGARRLGQTPRQGARLPQRLPARHLHPRVLAVPRTHARPELRARKARGRHCEDRG